MSRSRQRRIRRSGENERDVKPHKRKSVQVPDGALVPHPTANSLNQHTVLQMQQEKGNAYAQKSIGSHTQVQRDGESGETLTGSAEIPGIKGASETARVGDILTVLDAGLTVADIAAGAAGAAFVNSVAITAAAGAVGVAGAIFFMVGGLFALADAHQSGKKWAAVQGTAYGIISLAHGKEPPAAPGWMGDADAFNEAAQAVKDNMSSQAKKSKTSAGKVAGALLGLSRLPAEMALNKIYQQLVEAKLSNKFLGFIETGGSLYVMARDYYLTWPSVGGYYP